VFGQNLSNPIPDWAEHGADRKTVPYGVAKTMDTPNPDSGEEYPHVNTQLFGTIDPPTNRGLSYKSVVAPFNLPSGTPATINGFITDYITLLLLRATWSTRRRRIRFRFTYRRNDFRAS
jgi:phospholipase C